MAKDDSGRAQMKQPSNPFTPIFGSVPTHMAGRKGIINDMIQAFDEGRGNPNLSTLFVGARGTGKTALLSYLAREAQSRGWVIAEVTAKSGMLEDILERTRESSVHLIDNAAERKLRRVEIATIGSIEWDNLSREPRNWRSQMNALFEKLEPTETGILITVDEIDPSLDEMVQLVTTYQHFVREGKKTALLMAGLPHQVSTLVSGKSTSFLRRAFRHDLTSVPDYEIEDAFRMTLAEGGKTIDPDALSEAVAAIHGFPYMLQLVGYRAWNAVPNGDAIALDDVRNAIRLAYQEFENRVLNATYQELSENDVDFLRAMLADSKSTSRADLMERLGKGSSHISTYKRRLLERGVIEEPRKGVFEFALPGFREYLLEMEG